MNDMQEKNLKAIIQLMNTEDGASNEELKKELVSIIKTSPALVQAFVEREYKNSAPAHVRRVFEEAAWEGMKAEFSAYAAKINPDLEEGLYLASKFNTPSLTQSRLLQEIDSVVLELRGALLNCVDYLEIAHMIQRTLFGRLGFKPASILLKPKDVYFFNFLREKSGSSLSIACLYQLIGQRYCLDVEIIDFAGRILVRMQDPDFDAPFFIDPLDNGKILSEDDCRAYLIQRKTQWHNTYLIPMNSRAVTRRILSNLIYIYNKLDDGRRLAYLREYFSLLD